MSKQNLFERSELFCYGWALQMINERSSGAGFFLTTFFARTKKVVNIKLQIYYKNQLDGI